MLGKHQSLRYAPLERFNPMSEDLRRTIRSLLIEELDKHGITSSQAKTSRDREELVLVRTDEDLCRLVNRILRLAKDARARADIESGRHTFRLEGTPRSLDGRHRLDSRTSDAVTGESINFDRGLVTEKDILKMPDYIKTVNLGKSAMLTPLASDAIRRAGIKIEGR